MAASLKNYDQLCFTDNFMFCKILTSNTDITKEILEMILQIKIDKIKITQSQMSIETTAGSHGVRMDVYVEDDNKSVFDIEMQTSSFTAISKRTRYYQGMIDMDLLDRGVPYDQLRTSYIIFICLSDPFNSKRCIYTFDHRCVEEPDLKMGDETTKVFVNAAGNTEGFPEKIKSFLTYLKTNVSASELTAKIDAAVKQARLKEEWRREYMAICIRDMDIKQEGRAEGLAKGLAEGSTKRDREMITKKLLKGWSPERIHEDDEYPMELIIEVQKGLAAKA